MRRKANLRAALPALFGALLLYLAPQLCAATETATTPRIVVVLSDERAMYREVYQGLAATLASSAAPPHEIVVVELRDASSRRAAPNGGRPASLVVTVGTEAARAAAAWRPAAPVLCTLIPKAAFESIWRPPGDRPPEVDASAIYLDQPLARQMRLLRLLVPGADTLGVLLGQQSKRLRPDLQAAAKESGLGLYAREWRPGQDVAPLIGEVIRKSDVLLAVPDAELLTPHRAKWMLYMSYRQQRPLIGYSRSFVDSGALGAVFSTPDQIGRQAAEEILPMLTGRSPGAGGNDIGPPRHPKYYSVAANYSVARSLGRQIPTEAQLLGALEAAEDREP